MHHVRKRLQKKGWEKEHIKEAVAIFEEAEKKKHPLMHALDHATFWFSLLLAIAGNFIIALALVPVLLALEGSLIYIIVITIGVSFGLLFELLIRTIDHLEQSHHTILALLIPVVAVLTLLSIVLFANALQTTLQLKNNQNALVVACIYAVSFMLPYVVYQLILKRK